MRQGGKKQFDILISYQGFANASNMKLEKFEDDFLVFSVKEKDALGIIASATVNFPEINGNLVVFIHDIIPLEADMQTKQMLLDAVVSFAEYRGYREIFTNSARHSLEFLELGGFCELPGGILARRDVVSDESENMEMD